MANRQLRDALAMRALAAIIVRDGTPCNPAAQVKAAYHYADMMVAFRKPQKE